MQIRLAAVMACCGTLLVAESGQSLYSRSLTACVEARQGQGHNDANILVWKNLVVDTPELMYPMPMTVGSHTLQYLDSTEFRKRLKVARKPLPALEIKPIINRGAFLIVDCQAWSVSTRRGTLVKSYQGGATIRWRFECAAGDYVLVDAIPHSGPQM